MTMKQAPDRTKAPMRRQLWRWLRNAVLLLGAIILVLALVGITWQAIATRRDERRFPQQGRSYDVGGFRLNLNCTGQGSPAVVFDSGLGDPGREWGLVQPGIAKFSQVCSFDRAGYAWSDPGPLPRTSIKIAQELHVLLRNAGVPPPYILVGHSFGGLNVRVYNGQFPTEVAGIVLVDSSQEDQDSMLPESISHLLQVQTQRAKCLAGVLPTINALGIGRAMYALTSPYSKLPDKNLADELEYLYLQPKFAAASIDEFESFGESEKEARDSGDLDDKPLIVLTAGEAGKVPGIPQGDLDAFHRIWVNDLQLRLARLSRRGRRIVVDGSDHLIPFEKPEAVVSAVREVFDQLQVK